MQIKTISIFVFLLAGMLIVPTGLSQAQTSTGTGTGADTGTGEDTGTGADTGTGEDTGTGADTGTGEDTGTGADTGTGEDTGTGNATGTGEETGAAMNQTDNFIPETSAFVSKAITDFEKEKAETLNAINDCREKVKIASSGDVDSAMQLCKANLQSIKAKYQDERNQLSTLLHDYREGVMVMIKEAKGISVDNQFKETALEHMKEMKIQKMQEEMGSMTGGPNVQKGTATKNNTNCVNPPYGPKIC